MVHKSSLHQLSIATLGAMSMALPWCICQVVNVKVRQTAHWSLQYGVRTDGPNSHVYRLRPAVLTGRCYTASLKLDGISTHSREAVI